MKQESRGTDVTKKVLPKKKKKIAQKHLLLGNALLTNKVSNLIYISSTKRGVETVAQNSSKIADM
jgi:hypothetical protein